MQIFINKNEPFDFCKFLEIYVLQQYISISQYKIIQMLHNLLFNHCHDPEVVKVKIFLHATILLFGKCSLLF